jgi:hypothetical protein
LTEPYILILIALLVSVGNYSLWWLVFDEEFDRRLQVYQGALKTQLVRENEEFVTQMQGIIELDPEAVEVMGFGDNWKSKLSTVDRLRLQAESLKDRAVYVYYVSIVSILFSTMGIGVPQGIRITQSFTLYFTAISWWVIIASVLLMLGLLLIYQLIELKTVPKPQGKAIKNESLFSKTINNLRERSKR